MRRTLLALVFATTGLATAAVPASAASADATSTATANSTSATTAVPTSDGCSAEFFDDDPRLGPKKLPEHGVVGAELRGYERTGHLHPTQFLDTYYDPAANGGKGGWIYPPDNGYLIGADGQPIVFQLTLRPGQDMDRYGSQYGSFLAPAGSPYAERSIPPQNLDGNPAAGCNYHDYQVLKTFAVDAGPVAPWFGQPGGGLQYQLDGTLIPGAPTAVNVLWLVTNGYLEPIG